MPNPVFLVTGDETHDVGFEDGSTITIRTSVTAFQRARWSKAATTTKTKISGKGKKSVMDTDMQFDNEAFLRAMLSDIVVAWSATMPDGEPRPLDVSMIKDTAADRVREVFDELNPQPDDEDEDTPMGESVPNS